MWHYLLDVGLFAAGWGLRHYVWTVFSRPVANFEVELERARGDLCALQTRYDMSVEAFDTTLHTERQTSADTIADLKTKLQKAQTENLKAAQKSKGWLRSKFPYSKLPVVSRGQAVTVIFMRSGVEQSHRRVISEELKDTLTCPKGDSPKHEYTYSHLDSRNSFIYNFTRDIKDT